MLSIDNQSLLGFLAHSCTHYTANDSSHPAHSVSFSLIYPSYTKSLLVSPIIDDMSSRGKEGGDTIRPQKKRWASTLANRSNARHRSTIRAPPQMYVSKVWESVWPEGQEAIHS